MVNRQQMTKRIVNTALDEERDLAHEHDMEMLRREQLEADCGGDMADDWDDDDYEDEAEDIYDPLYDSWYDYDDPYLYGD